MKIVHETLILESSGKSITYHNLTNEVKKIIEENKISNGTVVVSSPHTTCSVIFEEFVHDFDWNGYEFLQVDLNQLVDRLIPRQLTESDYVYPGEEHVKFMQEISLSEGATYPNDKSSILNADAHLRASMFGASETFIIRKNKLLIGSVGYIYFVDWDQNRKRMRNCHIAVIGE